MVKYSKSAQTDDSIEYLGTFAAEMVGKECKYGRNEFADGNHSYWTSLNNGEGTTIFNISNSVKKVIDAQLEGVEDAKKRESIFLAAVGQATVQESNKRKPQSPEQRAAGISGDVVKDPATGEPVRVWKLVTQSEGLTEDKVKAAIALAPKFSLKSAMTSRI